MPDTVLVVCDLDECQIAESLAEAAALETRVGLNAPDEICINKHKPTYQDESGPVSDGKQFVNRM